MIYYHLPGLFEFYDFYQTFLALFKNHKEYFYKWCEIGSIYGNPEDCLWAGGRVSNGKEKAEDVLSLMNKYKISARLTLSNSLLKEEHLTDQKSNKLCTLFSDEKNGIIVHSELLLKYLKEKYPKYYFVSSTTKVLSDFNDFKKELERDEFAYVVIDYRLNKQLKKLEKLSKEEKDKVEFLVNECCYIGCKNRKECYESVSLKNLGIDSKFVCKEPEGEKGYRFSLAKTNPSFISVEDILNIYEPMGFTNFKIEGRGLGSAMLLEFILYYMVKPEYQLNVREEIYLDSMLDLF